MKMQTHIVMDAHGDTRHTFNPESEVEVREAMRRFDELLKTHIAARRLRNGCAECHRAGFSKGYAFNCRDDHEC